MIQPNVSRILPWSRPTLYRDLRRWITKYQFCVIGWVKYWFKFYCHRHRDMVSPDEFGVLVFPLSEWPPRAMSVDRFGLEDEGSVHRICCAFHASAYDSIWTTSEFCKRKPALRFVLSGDLNLVWRLPETCICYRKLVVFPNYCSVTPTLVFFEPTCFTFLLTLIPLKISLLPHLLIRLWNHIQASSTMSQLTVHWSRYWEWTHNITLLLIIMFRGLDLSSTTSIQAPFQVPFCSK